MTEEQKNIPGKWISVLSYITLLGWIIAILLNSGSKKQDIHSFHLRQSLGLNLSVLLISLIIFIPLLGLIEFLIGCFFFFLLWMVGVSTALKGQKKEVPVFGEYYQKWFKRI